MADVQGGDIRFRFTADNRELINAAKQVSDAMGDAADEASKATKKLDDTIEETTKATVELTDAEKRLAKEMVAAKKAAQEKAKALGLSTTELRKLEKSLEEAAEETSDLAEEQEKVIKTQKRLANASSKAASATRHTGTSFAEAGDKAGDLDSILKGLAGAVGVQSDEADRLLSKTGDLAGGFEAVARGSTLAGTSLAASVGAVVGVTTAAAALAAGFITLAAETVTVGPSLADLTQQMEEAEAAVRSATKGVLDMRPALAGLRKQADDLATDFRVAIGEIDELEGSAEKQKRAITESFDEQRKAQKALIDARKEERAAAEAQLRSGRQNIEGRAELQKQIEDLTRTIEAETGNLQALTAEERDLLTAVDNVTTAKQFAKQESEAEREEAKKAAEAKRLEAEAMRAAKVAAQEYTKALDDLARQAETAAAGSSYAEAVRVLGVLEAATRDDIVATAELVEEVAALERALMRIEAEIDFEATFAPISDARDPVRQLAAEVDALVPPESLERMDQLNLLLLQLQTESAKSEESAAALADSVARVQMAIGEEREVQHQAELERIQEERDARVAALDETLAIQAASLDALGQLAILGAKKMGSTEKELAEFRKKIALTQAIISTAQAITTAIASAPWPANVPAISFAAITGAAQIATIQAESVPAMHTGGVVGDNLGTSRGSADPSERLHMLRVGERVLTQQERRDYERPQPITVNMTYRGKVVDTMVSDTMAGGTKSRRVLRKGTTNGRRPNYERRV